jgi:hypothetical protein
MATREDAALIVQILQWGALSGLDDAFHAINSDDFDPETATAHNPSVRKVLNFGETVSTFVKQGLLDRALVIDLWALHLTWKRVGSAALRAREHTGEPRMFENFEALVRGVPASV